MNINELIAELKEIKAKEGNLPVRTAQEFIYDGSHWFSDIQHAWVCNDPETDEKVVAL